MTFFSIFRFRILVATFSKILCNILVVCYELKSSFVFQLHAIVLCISEERNYVIHLVFALYIVD